MALKIGDKTVRRIERPDARSRLLAAYDEMLQGVRSGLMPGAGGRSAVASGRSVKPKRSVMRLPPVDTSGMVSDAMAGHGSDMDSVLLARSGDVEYGGEDANGMWFVPSRGPSAGQRVSVGKGEDLNEAIDFAIGGGDEEMVMDPIDVDLGGQEYGGDYVKRASAKLGRRTGDWSDASFTDEGNYVTPSRGPSAGQRMSLGPGADVDEALDFAINGADEDMSYLDDEPVSTGSIVEDAERDRFESVLKSRGNDVAQAGMGKNGMWFVPSHGPMKGQRVEVGDGEDLNEAIDFIMDDGGTDESVAEKKPKNVPDWDEYTPPAGPRQRTKWPSLL